MAAAIEIVKEPTHAGIACSFYRVEHDGEWAGLKVWHSRLVAVRSQRAQSKAAMLDVGPLVLSPVFEVRATGRRGWAYLTELVSLPWKRSVRSDGGLIQLIDYEKSPGKEEVRELERRLVKCFGNAAHRWAVNGDSHEGNFGRCRRLNNRLVLIDFDDFA